MSQIPKRFLIVAARKDRADMQCLAALLDGFVHEGRIQLWHNDNMEPGAAWDEVLPQRLQDANIIAVLCSRDASNDPYYADLIEMALERVRNREPVVLVPVLLDLSPVPFGFRRLRATPDAVPINERSDPESGWGKVVQDFSCLLDKLSRT
jgi:hypothetical protein